MMNDESFAAAIKEGQRLDAQRAERDGVRFHGSKYFVGAEDVGMEVITRRVSPIHLPGEAFLARWENKNGAITLITVGPASMLATVPGYRGGKQPVEVGWDPEGD